ncbi:hypothetical protein AB0M39_14005 [Streptomyces sp. NPDC051907]|uniref:hypothetical protein n=1 Tax=Streptomyces sp. NPDC051907 TaxID=3155284 RepID=UPI00343F8FDE
MTHNSQNHSVRRKKARAYLQGIGRDHRSKGELAPEPAAREAVAKARARLVREHEEARARTPGEALDRLDQYEYERLMDALELVEVDWAAGTRLLARFVDDDGGVVRHRVQAARALADIRVLASMQPRVGKSPNDGDDRSKGDQVPSGSAREAVAKARARLVREHEETRARTPGEALDRLEDYRHEELMDALELVEVDWTAGTRLLARFVDDDGRLIKFRAKAARALAELTAEHPL